VPPFRSIAMTLGTLFFEDRISCQLRSGGLCSSSDGNNDCKQNKRAAQDVPRKIWDLSPEMRKKDNTPQSCDRGVSPFFVFLPVET